ncbi:hypothetical protein GCM10023093_31440 [Nemorincola caseinilytica]|uniref:Carboxypeptidase regulatory-like domain-containing protein n=1 Tax=Nemorincola caseinilytica TaxID=2054315 RepID=A0ABP8NSV2_9BACT
MKILLQLLLAFVCSGAYAQGSAFRFRFFNEQTGIRVIPEHMMVTSKANGDTAYKVEQGQVAANGTVTLPIPDGRYDVTVIAHGYEAMSTWLEVKQQTLNVNFRLVNKERVRELAPEYLRSIHRPDAVVITGFVIDDATGLPLSNVTVKAADGSASAVSDSGGLYRLILPLPTNKTELTGRDVLHFAQEGYTTEQRSHFDLWPDGDMILNIRMKQGAGSHSETIVTKREIHHELYEP